MDKWNEFLKSGKVEDYLEFRNQSRFMEADRQDENAKQENKEEKNHTFKKSGINGDYYE